MSCSNCAKSYTLFVRENACAKCGFGFCSNCLQKKLSLPTDKGMKEAKVCNACYNSIQEPSKSGKVAQPKTHLEQGLETLQPPPPKMPITIYKDDSKFQNLKKGLSAEDQEIAERLEKLKKKQSDVPTDREMAKRLAKLKEAETDLTNSEENEEPKGFFVKPDKRADGQKADDLIEQMNSEIDIDKKTDPANEISERLAKLRGVASIDEVKGGGGGTTRFDDDDVELPSDEEAENVIGQLLEEQSLEEKTEDGDLDLKDMDEPPPISKQMQGLVRQLTKELADADTEEMPWCVICNEDAVLRCKDCDEDLYCNRCFKDCHSEFEMDHQSVPFKVKK